jgi:alkylation response protein AidB-like acyl-CoA dehydrogenase
MAYEDTSAGWALLICAGLPMILGSRLPADGRTEIFGKGCVPSAGVFNPGGSGTVAADGSITVSGKWPFASGVTYAEWAMANVIALDESGAPLPGTTGNGMPLIMSVVVRRDDITVVDDWHVAGLRGTGSMSFTLENHTVPAHRTFPFFSPAAIDEPRYRLPLFGFIGATFAGMAVGLAQRALDEVIAVLPTRVGPPTFQPASADPVNQMTVGRTKAALRGVLEASRSLYRSYTDRLLAGEDLTDLPIAERADLHQHAMWAAETSVNAVNDLFRLGGASSIYEPNILQRIWRDINVLNQHVFYRAVNHKLGGEIALGFDVVAPML